MDQSDSGSVGIFSRWTNRTQEATTKTAPTLSVSGSKAAYSSKSCPITASRTASDADPIPVSQSDAFQLIEPIRCRLGVLLGLIGYALGIH
eukprot:3180436-Pyramimonas_sp.AAC.1